MIKSSYYSTHKFLVDQFGDLPELYKEHLIRHSHEVRKIQDQFCYIHSRNNSKKVFSPTQHKNLESSIRNNLKFFVISYIEEIPLKDIYSNMLTEALLQRDNLRHMTYIQVVLNRISEINYFLNYSFSRSYDYYLSNERFSDQYATYVMGISKIAEAL